ncbi:MAG: NAD-dependent epimerase/dehydratase family protein [Anaerolineae bacterium]|nr:NAD-dependent epimerase/dehydratase family protein [Anaerolineae bacterium]
MSERILVTGAVGQIGSELTTALRERHGSENVIAAGHRTPPSPELRDAGPFIFLDVTHAQELAQTVRQHGIGTIYHMAAILSAVGEARPQLCWDVNMNGLTNILELARERGLRLFCPSSIAVFGPETPRERTPQETVLRPRTMYGVTKVAGELLCEYYVRRFDVDVRGVRYPGIISNVTPPGGGTTDYAVEIYYEAIRNARYTCFVRPDTVLPMMYMPDCIKATLDLMDADPARLIHHADFNLAAITFSAEELAAEIGRHVPGFAVDYEPDPVRQAIADSWPKTIDDSAAREEWDWEPSYDLAAMTVDMLEKLGERHRRGAL